METSKIDNIEKLIKEKGAQFRSFDYSAKREVTEAGDELIVEGRAAVFDSPTLLFKEAGVEYWETVDRHALDEADVADVIFNYNHAGRVYARTRNKSLELELTDGGLDMRAHLWADDNGHQALFNDIDRGNIDKMSWAFTIDADDWEFDDENNKATRTIRRVGRVFDVSAVDIPAYNDTAIQAAERDYIAASEEYRRAKDEAESLRAQKDALKEKIEKELEHDS